jgi:hypothetical protein
VSDLRVLRAQDRVRHLRPRARALLLLENGRARAKSQCGRLDGVCPVVSYVKNTSGTPTSVGVLPVGGRVTSDRLSDFSKGLPFAEISMESLILAQDERWRRA